MTHVGHHTRGRVCSLAATHWHGMVVPPQQHPIQHKSHMSYPHRRAPPVACKHQDPTRWDLPITTQGAEYIVSAAQAAAAKNAFTATAGADTTSFLSKSYQAQQLHSMHSAQCSAQCQLAHTYTSHTDHTNSQTHISHQHTVLACRLSLLAPPRSCNPSTNHVSPIPGKAPHHQASHMA